MARTLPEVLHEIEQLIVELLESQAPKHAFSELNAPAPESPEGLPPALNLCCPSPERSRTRDRSSSKSSYTPPRSHVSFNSALRGIQDFSRTITTWPEQDEDVGKQGFQVHREWQEMIKLKSDKRTAITRRSSFQQVLDAAATSKGSMLDIFTGMGSKIEALLSIAFISADLVLLPLFAFGIEHGFLDVLSISFWAMRLLARTLRSIAPLSKSREKGRVGIFGIFGIFRCSVLACAAWVLEASLVAARVALAVWGASPSAKPPLAWGSLSALQFLRLAAFPHLYEASGMATFLHNMLRKTSREVRAGWNVAWMGLLSLICLHSLTCAWFGVGVQSGGWAEDALLAGLPWYSQYARSTEWALSRLPPSRITENMELHTPAERWLSVFSTALCVLFASIFTSVVTNDISDLRRLKRMRKEAEDKLFDYLQVHPVPPSLEQHLSSYARRHMSRVTPPGKAELAASLPHFLYEELCQEALLPVVSGHSLLNGLCCKYAAFRRDLCVRCLMDWHVMAQETLFLPGGRCESLLFIARGNITYSKTRLPLLAGSQDISRAWTNTLPASNVSSMPTSLTSLTLSEGDWLCEQCLWTSWTYLGQAGADTGADMLCLGRDKVFELAQVCKEAASEIAKYAELAVALLNSTAEESLSDLPIELSPEIQ